MSRPRAGSSELGPGDDAGSGPESGGDAGAASGADENVVDADFEEVDDDKKGKNA